MLHSLSMLMFPWPDGTSMFIHTATSRSPYITQPWGTFGHYKFCFSQEKDKPYTIIKGQVVNISFTAKIPKA